MDRQEGVVAEWNPRGFGFINFADGRRAYVHNSACGGEHLEVGETITASVAADATNPGKWAAHEVHRTGLTGELAAAAPPAVVPQRLAVVGAAPQVRPRQPEVIDLPQPTEVELEPGRLLGVVQEWNPRGFGFLQFSDGRRAYVHNSQCGGDHLAEGETVSAMCTEDPKNPGKWAAAQVQRDPGTEDGVVTDWKEEGGFGFLTVTDGRRAYVHRSAFGGKGSLFVGMRLKVTLKPDPRNAGKWCVNEVRRTLDDAASPAPAAAVPALAAAQAQLAAPLAIGAPPIVPVQAAPAVVDPVADSRAVHACTVTEWDARGFGFVKADDGRRAFVHNSSCGGEHLQVGEAFTANIHPDPQNPGKWAVANVQRGAVMVGENGLVTGEQGTVTDWNDTGGYGFLSMDDGRRAYIHRSSFGGTGALVEGSKLIVTTKPDPRNPGKWSVDQVKGQVATSSEEALIADREAAAAADRMLLNAITGSLDTSRAAVTSAAALHQPQQQTQLDGQVTGGSVTDWHEGGGYGFLSLDDGRRAYIHRSSFGGKGDLEVGARLQVTTRPDPRNAGKWCVGQVVGGLSGDQVLGELVPEAAPQAQGEEGVVSEWKEEGGYGFLNMSDGRRAYIHRSAFGGSGSLTIGLGLQVSLKADPRNPGKWCVGEVLGILANEGAAEDPVAKRLRTA